MKRKRVTADKAKSGKARAIPLNAEAVAILKSRQELDKQWVFTRDTGVHTSDIDRNSFNLAAKKAGLKDFHFHDLRHTWASWHVQAGTPLFVLKEMGGWENLEMVKKYARLSVDHSREWCHVFVKVGRKHNHGKQKKPRARRLRCLI